jgi:hypothetical protein
MFAVPATDMPVTTPVLLTVAVPVALLLHAPPGVTSFNVVVVPTQIPRLPVISAGDMFTVTTAVLTQPVPSE